MGGVEGRKQQTFVSAPLCVVRYCAFVAFLLCAFLSCETYKFDDYSKVRFGKTQKKLYLWGDKSKKKRSFHYKNSRIADVLSIVDDFSNYQIVFIGKDRANVNVRTSKMGIAKFFKQFVKDHKLRVIKQGLVVRVYTQEAFKNRKKYGLFLSKPIPNASHLWTAKNQTCEHFVEDLISRIEYKVEGYLYCTSNLNSFMNKVPWTEAVDIVMEQEEQRAYVDPETKTIYFGF